MFKHRITVAEPTLGGIQGKDLARLQVDRVERVKAVLQFNAVGTQVLHRSGAHRARNKRHVFKAGIALLQRPGHEIVPVLASARLHHKGFGRFFHQAPALDLDFQDQRFDVTGEHNIAAAAQYKFGPGTPFGAGDDSLHVGFTGNADEGMRLGHNVEGVARLEGDVFLD